MDAEVKFTNQMAIDRKPPEERGRKCGRVKVQGVMASSGRWSAWGRDNGEALARLNQLLELNQVRPFQSAVINERESG